MRHHPREEAFLQPQVAAAARDERRRARRNKKMAKKALKHLDTMRDDLFETWSSFSEIAMGNFEESMKVHDEARERYVDSPENYGEWVKGLNEETIEKLDEIIDLFQEHCGEVFEECFDGLINICQGRHFRFSIHVPTNARLGISEATRCHRSEESRATFGA